MSWQTFIILFTFLNTLFFIKALFEIKKRNVYGLTKYLFFLGAFVWGDVFVLSPFWILVSLFSLFFKNLFLFLLLTSLFWTIRSLGEITYWINEQFAFKKRNPPETLNFHNLIKGDAIWFVYQVFWECVFVFALLASIYFSFVIFK